MSEIDEEVEIAFKYAAIRESMYGTKYDLVPIILKVDIDNIHAVREAGKLFIMLFRVAIWEITTFRFSLFVAVRRRCGYFWPRLSAQLEHRLLHLHRIRRTAFHLPLDATGIPSSIE